MVEEQLEQQWHCASAIHKEGAKIFSTQEEFENHMTQEHKVPLTGPELSKLSERSMRPAFRLFLECPLCDFEDTNKQASEYEVQDNLQRHVADHLQSLALFSLPILLEDGFAYAPSEENSGEEYNLDDLDRKADLSFGPLSNFSNGPGSPLEPTVPTESVEGGPRIFIYPIRIPPEKLAKALELYVAFKKEQFVTITHSDTSSSKHSGGSFEASAHAVRAKSDDDSSIAHQTAEVDIFVSHRAENIKVRKRKPLSPLARTKAALIRHLGSCPRCRTRRVRVSFSTFYEINLSLTH